MTKELREPPLLSEKERDEVDLNWRHAGFAGRDDLLEAIARAQRELDIKYFTGGKMIQHEKPLSERLPEHIFSRIHQDIGEASTCWTKLEKAGTFDAEHASKIAFNLCHFVADELEKSRC